MLGICTHVPLNVALLQQNWYSSTLTFNKTDLPVELVELAIEGGDELHELPAIIKLHGRDGRGQEWARLGGGTPNHLSSVGKVQGC